MLRLVAAIGLVCVGACAGGAARVTGAAGTPTSGVGAAAGAAGSGSTDAAGQSPAGAAGAGAGGAVDAGAGPPGATDDGATGGSNTVDADATGAAGTAGDFDPPPPRPINVKPGGVSQMSFNGQSMYLNRNKPIMGKLFLLLGGICTGTGAGGFEAFIKQYGFHVFAPITQTCVAGAPSKYKTVLQTTPNDPEANRQVGDARMELWDGKDRVDWVTVAAGASILEETIGAIKAGVAMEPEADWGYFLNTDGTLRTTDVWVVGYSWGSQTWAMISSYVRFGRVITTSGPTDEGFPNASWITHPSATPNDRKYLLVGQTTPYPAEIEPIIPNVMKAGWIGAVTNVTPTSPGPYTAAQHLFAMIGGNGGVTPPGHTVFCNDNPMDGWLPLCRYVLGVP